MDIATLKQQARTLEQQGDTAGALGAYQNIIDQLERSAIEPEGPLYVKVGDLLLKSGNRQGAVTMFERAASRYASMGSAKSVIALCLKILRTDPSRTHAHVRYARQMFGRGHVEATRRVLVDYAERAHLAKTHQTLERLGQRSIPEITAKLEEFFSTVDRGVRQTGARQAMSAPPSSVRPSETAEHLAVMADAVLRRDPAAQAQPGTTTPFRAKPAGAPQPVAPVRRDRRRADRRKPAKLSALLARRWSARPVWMWPAAAAAAVLVAGIALMAAGAIPFGGDLDAEQPPPTQALDGRTAALTLMTAATLDSLWFTEEPDTAPVLPPEGPEPATPGPTVAPAEPITPQALDRHALVAASEAALVVDAGQVDVELDNSIFDAGKIEVPTDVPLTFAEPPRAAAARPSPSSPVVAIDGLEIAAVARGPNSYQVVQRLSSGERVTLTVIPFTEAPEGDNGQLQVEASRGDSAVGTRRFRDLYVTARGPLRPADMRRLLSKLSERSGQ
jgi:hypothetical protein